MKKIKLLFIMLLLIISIGCKVRSIGFKNKYKFTIRVDNMRFHTNNLKVEESVLHFIDKSGKSYHIPTVNIEYIKENY